MQLKNRKIPVCVCPILWLDYLFYFGYTKG